jgi:hypothetical protein
LSSIAALKFRLNLEESLMSPDQIRQTLGRALMLFEYASTLTPMKLDDEAVRVLKFAVNDTEIIEELYRLLQAKGAV